MSQFSLPSLRLILFTTQPPLMVKTLIETFEACGQQVLLLVTSPRPYQIPHGIMALSSPERIVLISNHMDQLPAILSGLAPDLIFCAGFPLRFPPELLALPRLGCVNAHSSLLPKYRGPRPVLWQLMDGETQTGMTFHRMDTDFDTGPILVQHALDITPEDDARSLWDKLLKLEVSMLPEMLALISEGAPGTPQPTTGASYAPLPSVVECQLDWTCPAIHLHKQVRALALEGAQAQIDGQLMLVRRARVVASPNVSAIPGTLLACTAEGILMQTGKDALMVTEYIYEDRISQSFVPKKQ